MANFLSNDESIQGKWGPPPKLDAPNIAGTLAAILNDKLQRQKMLGSDIAGTIKNVMASRQRDAYTEALRNAGLTQGQDISGLSDSDATRLATLIQAQTPDTVMDNYHKALTAEAQARTDALNDPSEDTTIDPAEQRRQDAEKRRETSDRIKALQSQMKSDSLPSDAVPHALAPGETVTPGMYPFDVGGKRVDQPKGNVNDFNTARRTYDALIRQRANAQAPGGSAVAGGGSSGGQYPVGTHARSGSVWYKKVNPTPDNPTGWEVDPTFSQ
jgi:hypothetical protein